MLGFDASSFKDDDSEFDAMFSGPEGRFLGEVEGKENKAINVNKISQLHRNVAEDLVREEVTGPAVPVHLSSLADLRAKMQAGGMTLKDIEVLEASLTTGELSNVVEGGVPADADEDDNLPQTYWTTYAMRMRAGARLNLLDAQLNEVLIDLGTLVDETGEAALNKAQRAWLVYRRQEMRYAASHYEGGTIAPLIAVAHAISVTERRIEQMREEVVQRKRFPN